MTNSTKTSLELIQKHGANIGDNAETAAYNARAKIMELAKQIRKMRVDAGFSQTELAEAVDMRQADISRLESGLAKQGPSIPTIERLAVACGYTYASKLLPTKEADDVLAQVESVLQEAKADAAEIVAAARKHGLEIILKQEQQRGVQYKPLEYIEMPDGKTVIMKDNTIIEVTDKFEAQLQKFELQAKRLEHAAEMHNLWSTVKQSELQTEGIVKYGVPLFGPVDERDDLKQIFGIGPVMEKTLNRLGITSYSQLAELKQHDINKLSEALDMFPGRIERDDWVGGARKQYEKTYKKEAGTESG